MTNRPPAFNLKITSSSFLFSLVYLNLPMETFNSMLPHELVLGFSMTFSGFQYVSLCLSHCRVPEGGGGCSPHGSVHHSLQSDGAGGESSSR